MSTYFINFPKTTYLNRSVTDITRRVKINDDVLLDPYSFLPYTVKGEDRPEDVARYYYGDQNKVWLVYLANNIIDPYTQWPMSNRNLDRTLEKKYSQVAVPFDSLAIDFASNIITVNNHGFKTTDPVSYSVVTGSTVGGLSNGSTYYVIRVTDNTIKLATSAANAIAGSEINLTTATGTYTVQRNTLVWLQSTAIKTNIVFYRNYEDPSVTISADTFELDNSLITSEWYAVRAYDYEVELNEDRRVIYLINNIYAKQVEEDLKKVLNE